MKKTKKIAALIMTIAVAAGVFAGCSSNKQTTTNSLDAIKKAGVVKIGLNDDYKPFEYRDTNNNLVGFDIDFGNKIAEKLGVRAEFVTTDFNGIILALNSDKFNMIISGLSVTDERKKEIAFAGPYLDSGQAIIVKADSNINSVADLKDKIIGVQLGSTGEKAAQAVKGTAEIKSYNNALDALMDLSIGRTDAVIADLPVLVNSSNEKPGSYRVLSEILSKEPMGVGLKKTDTELTAEVQKIYEGLLADGTMSELSKKWFKFDAYAK